MTSALESGFFLTRAAFSIPFASLGSPALAFIHSCGRHALLHVVSRALAQGNEAGTLKEDKRLRIAEHL